MSAIDSDTFFPMYGEFTEQGKPLKVKERINNGFCEDDAKFQIYEKEDLELLIQTLQKAIANHGNETCNKQ